MILKDLQTQFSQNQKFGQLLVWYLKNGKVKSMILEHCSKNDAQNIVEKNLNGILILASEILDSDPKFKKYSDQ